MADYYSLLARAVANLPKSAPPSARRAIYERARKALTNQLRSLKPSLPESDIAREERALDEAVAKLETEFEASAAELQALTVGAGADSPTGDMAAAERARNARAPAPPPMRAFEPQAFRPAPPPPRTVAPVIAPRNPPPAMPRAPIPRVNLTPAPPTPPPAAPPPTPAAPSGLPAAAAFRAAPLAAEPAPPPPPPPPPPPEPAFSAAEPEDFEDNDAPALGGAYSRFDREPARPTLQDGLRRNRSTWLWVALAVAFGFAGSIAVVAYLLKPALRDLSPPASVDTPVAQEPAGPGKTVSRVGPASGAPDSPTPTTASPTTEAPAAASPSPVASATPTPTPLTDPTPSETPTPKPTVVASPSAEPTPAAPPPSATSVPIASRAAMLVATVADAAKPAISVGTAVWSVVPAPAGQPQGVGVKAEIDVPDLKMHASMILRRNFDASLPASHTIDLRLTFDPGSPLKGVKDIALPLMRRDDPPAADALAGVRVKISDNYFLIGLNRGDADISKNLQMIGERGWFDFPMQLDDDRIAKLTFEKGADGEKIVAQALAAWK